MRVGTALIAREYGAMQEGGCDVCRAVWMGVAADLAWTQSLANRKRRSVRRAVPWAQSSNKGTSRLTPVRVRVLKRTLALQLTTPSKGGAHNIHAPLIARINRHGHNDFDPYTLLLACVFDVCTKVLPTWLRSRSSPPQGTLLQLVIKNSVKE